MVYWDTSALLKLYVAEPDSPYFVDLLRSAREPLLTSEIAKAEVLCALYRKEHAGALKPGASEVVFGHFLSHTLTGKIVISPYGEDVFAEVQRLVKLAYGGTRPVMMRSLDAIHLASAVTAKAKVLIATDTRLRAAAQLAGLEVTPPA